MSNTDFKEGQYMIVLRNVFMDDELKYWAMSELRPIERVTPHGNIVIDGATYYGSTGAEISRKSLKKTSCVVHFSSPNLERRKDAREALKQKAVNDQDDWALEAWEKADKIDNEIFNALKTASPKLQNGEMK